MAEQERKWEYQAHPRDNHEYEEDTRHDHDVDTLILQSHKLYKAAKQMKIQQSKISKRQKKNNERLDKSKGKYSNELQDLKEALEKVNKIVAGTRQNEQFDLPHLPQRQEQKKGATSLPRLGNEKTRQPMLDTFQNRCEQCEEKERLINEQLLEMDRTEASNHKLVQKLYEKVDSLSREINKEKVLKEDALRRLIEIASSKLQDNNPNIADLSDTNRPLKLAEKLSELYDNAWTDAIEAMQTSNENEAIQELLTMLMEVYRRCMGLATDGFFERIQRSILYPQDGGCGKERLPDQMKQQIKEFRKYEAPNVKEAVAKVVLANLTIKGRNEPEIEKYLKDCVEICWLAVVQDPPLFLSSSHTVEFDKNAYKEYTQSGRYVEFVVWPAVYLHKDGPLLSKGVAQGSNTHPRGAVLLTSNATRLVSNVSAHIVHRSVSPNARSDVAGIGQIASSKLRDNNPNIADLSDTNRPTKLAEKLSELYDNAWTDAIEAMQTSNENEDEAIQELLKMLMEVYRRCMGLATDGFFERIQRSILYPQDGVCGKERLPDQMKQQIKEFRKYEAPNVKEAVAKVVLANLPIGDRNEPEIEKYLKDCVEICWLAVVQDPPLFLSSSHTVEFDKNAYKEYTQSGQYVEFIVWPALYLHKDGPLLSKGVAQGSNTHQRGEVMQTSHATRLVPNASAQNVHQ